MQFTTLAGLLFIALAALVCNALPVRFRPAVILVASYVFYCTWDPWMAAALAVVTGICYGAGIQIERRRSAGRGGGLVAIVAGSLVLYVCYYKALALIRPDASLAVPLGISYYTFRLISYVVDVYWGTIAAERSAIRFAAFVAFFPHLVAGPIQRAGEFLPQVNPARADWGGQAFRGLSRILLGLFKKLAVADPLALLVGYGFAHAGEGPAVPSLLAFYVFPLQLYMDFAALTDVAIGVGLLFGIESPENFDRPFAASSISEFWRRWHMSLTGWLRDYVFMPMRMGLRAWGNRGLVLSITVNMILIALWHGFRMNFLVFGLIHSAYLIVDALSSGFRKRYFKQHPTTAGFAAVAGTVLTYHLVAIADVFFRAATVQAGMKVLVGLFAGWSGMREALTTAVAPPNHHAWSGLAFAGLAVFGDALRRRWPVSLSQLQPRWLRWSAGTAVAMGSVFLMLMMLAGRRESSPFLYENF